MMARRAGDAYTFWLYMAYEMPNNDKWFLSPYIFLCFILFIIADYAVAFESNIIERGRTMCGLRLACLQWMERNLLWGGARKYELPVRISNRKAWKLLVLRIYLYIIFIHFIKWKYQIAYYDSISAILGTRRKRATFDSLWFCAYY